MKKLISLACLSAWGLLVCAQVKNTHTEVKNYREADGKIILEMVVNGVFADFVLDLAGHTAILPEYLEKLKIDTTVRGNFSYDSHQYKRVPVARDVNIKSILFGNSVYENDVPAFILKDEPYLRKLGVAGIVNGSLFRNVVLTIDARRKKITMSSPYRPSYMKLDHRMLVSLKPSSAICCPVVLDGKKFSLLLDTWNDGTLVLNSSDFVKLPAVAEKGGKIAVGYAKTETETEKKEVGECYFVKNKLQHVAAVENSMLPYSVLGNGILKQGLLSVDYGKQKIYFQPFDLVQIQDEIDNIPEIKIEAGKLNPITREYFLQHIADYRKNAEFIFKGDKPVVIDFWASWCGPCMRLIPEMEKMAEQYKDQVVFLKVNADKEKELCEIYGITALPTLFFIPVGGKPIVEIGATPEKFTEIIEQQLLNRK